MAECGCGRSPNGNCVGWHDLTEEQYLEKKAAYEAKQAAKQERPGCRLGSQGDEIGLNQHF